MDTPHFFAYGIFFVVVTFEMLFSLRRNLKLYQGRDITNNIVLGLFTTLFMLAGKGTFLAPFDIGMTWWTWIVLFLLNDLIIWDRLFRTSRKEREPAKFGITKQVDRQNVPDILFHEFIAMGKDIGKSRLISDGLRFIFGHPGWSYGQAK